MISALQALGFKRTAKPGKGSHEHWEATINGLRQVVTVACHNGEVKAGDFDSIISQSGVPKKRWKELIN